MQAVSHLFKANLLVITHYIVPIFRSEQLQPQDLTTQTSQPGKDYGRGVQVGSGVAG